MRRWQFSLGSMFLLITIAAMLLVPAVEILRMWWAVTSATVTVRVTSSGTVKFGKEEVLVDECLPMLTHSFQDLRSAGFTPELLVEAYSNTKPADVETVVEIGKQAGFERVDTGRLDWVDSPP